METMQNAIVILGLTSVTLLWVFCTAGALSVLWETFGEHIQSIIKRYKG